MAPARACLGMPSRPRLSPLRRYNNRMSFAVALAASLVFAMDDPIPHVGPNPDLPLNVPPPTSRFELQDPCGGLAPIMLDWANDSIGLAQQATRGAKRYQARIMWIDATANIERYNTEEKI